MLINLLWALRDRQTLGMKDAVISILVETFDFARQVAWDGINADHSFRVFMERVREKNDPEYLQSLICKLAEKLGPITLVFDEANIVFKISDKTSSTDIKIARRALALFTSLTKKMNMVIRS